MHFVSQITLPPSDASRVTVRGFFNSLLDFRKSSPSLFGEPLNNRVKQANLPLSCLDIAGNRIAVLPARLQKECPFSARELEARSGREGFPFLESRFCAPRARIHGYLHLFPKRAAFEGWAGGEHFPFVKKTCPPKAAWGLTLPRSLPA
jgi:hypothetical protein